MKKNLFSMGVMLAAAFTLTNCAKEMEHPVQEPSVNGTFEIIACTVDTKTANEGMSTKWTAADSINVFHAEAGSEAYVNDGRFEIAEADLASGRFIGELGGSLKAEATYDWYAFYPYAEQKTSPADGTAGWAYVGHSKGLTQDGYDNMAALKGSVCPLYGISKAVAGDKTPAITMEHLSSVIAIEVENVTDSPLTVKTASFEADQSIVGSFYITFEDGEPDYIDSGDDYVKNIANVSVKNGTPLKKGEKATLYLAVKPFTAEAEGELGLTVNGYEKRLTITEEVTFHAGKIKTLKFKYDKVEAPLPEGVVKATLTFDDKSKRTEYDTDHQVWVENGITFTNEKGSSTSNVGDFSNPARFYKSSNITISAPGNILALEFDCTGLDEKYVTPLSSLEVDGTTNTITYEKLSAQARAYAVTVTYTEGEGGGNQEPVQPEEPKTVTIADFIAAEESEQVYQLTGTITSVESSDYGNFDITDETGTVYIYGLVDADGSYVYTDMELKEGDIVTVKGQRTSYNGTPQMENALYVSHVVGEAPEDTMMGETTVTAFLAAEVDAHVWYELTGVIANLNNTTYGNFDLVDETGSVYVYGLTSAKTDSNDKSFASLGLKEGDVVTLIGTRADFNGTAQVGGPAYYDSHKASCPAPVVTCENNIVTITSAPGATVYYTTDGEDPTTSSSVYSSAFTIHETVTVRAIAVESGKPQSAVTSTVCYWVDPNGGDEITYEAELSFTDKANRTSFSGEKQVWEQNGIVFTNDKASSSNNVADYANPVRLYQGSTVTINMAKEDEQIVKIEFESDGTAKYKTALLNSLTGAGITPTVAGNVYTIELPGPADSFTFSLTAQARLKNLKVTYTN
ncbi:MAG: chitobiase/beta-hexosaminidase C-terminal domain-containing protein [Bacteroidales bacterium]|nr:chitobiase/beta-hexosaminidase C-terminal domain-containing protein [Bacteroidales bacterium]